MDQEMLKLAEEYAVIAEELLEDNGMPYDEDDVIKVASFLIDNEVDFEDEDDEDEEFDEEDVRLAAFYDELEKDAGKLGKRISGHLYNTGVGLSNKLWGKGPKKGAKLNWRQNLARKMVRTNKNARRTGAAVYGAGALAAGGAGYGIYRGTRKNK